MRTLRVTAFVLAFTAVAAIASAQTPGPPPQGNVGFFGAYTAQASDGLDRGHGFGASATFFFSRLIGVEGGVRRQAFDVTETADNSLSGGELKATVVTAGVVVRGGDGNIQPYVTGGIAFFSNSYEIDPAVQAQLATFNFTALESIDNAAGFNVGGGADFIATPRIGFFVEGRYCSATADSSGGLRDDITQISTTVSGQQKLSIFVVSGGVRIFF